MQFSRLFANFSQGRQLLLGGAVVGASLFVASSSLIACSSSAATSGCDESKCAKDNKCITRSVAGKDETKCRLTCSAQSGALGCPFGYQCTNGGKTAAGEVAYCSATTYLNAVTRKDKGQWGSSCNPVNGGSANTDCDGAQGFSCFAKSPTDGNAFCTTIGCAADVDCPGGYWCATVNAAPNADTKDRGVADTVRACLPRAHCSTCATDIDCPANGDGQNQKCVADSAGKKACAAECGTDANCPKDAFCNADLGNVCSPRVGFCAAEVGKGGFCDPCRSDADCVSSICVSSDTTEKFCGVKSGTKCTLNGSNQLIADCPKAISATTFTSCTTSTTDGLPADTCVGVVPYNPKDDTAGAFRGCYALPRK